MKTVLVFLVLCSELSCCTSASHRLRWFPDHNNEKNFSESKSECQQDMSSLVTLYDKDEAIFIDKIFKPDHSDMLWLGLTRKTEHFTTWSDKTPVLPKYNVTVSMWEQKCGAFENYTLTHENCSEPKYFMCYQGSNYTLIKEKKNWCQALQHCRRNFTDLVSINNTTPQQLIEEGKNTSFWVGLLHDQWEWADGGCSTFREWENDPDKNEYCTAQSRTPLLYRHGCKNYIRVFCSKGYVRIKVIYQSSTWEQAFDYCNKHHTGPLRIENGKDQEAVEQWLSHNTTEGIDGPFWIGLRQSRIFGFWIWSNTTAVYSNWKDSIQPELPMSHPCGAIDRNGSWIDKECWRELPFLCEEEMFFM